MNWKDNRQIKDVAFGALAKGDVFIYDNIIYIKVANDEAFDICNNCFEDFPCNTAVEKRDATLVLD